MTDDHRSPGQKPPTLPRLALLESDPLWVCSLKSWLTNLVRSLAVVSTVIVLVLACSACQTQAQELEKQFNAASSADTRIKCLAGLLKLPGQEHTARELFDSQSQADKIALFKLSNPEAVSKELVVVVKAFYVDLPNDTNGNELLSTMDSPLASLLQDTDARSLSVEIQRWLQGRKSYNSFQDAAAVEAYSYAIDQVNPRNPGTRLDRALAYARQNQPAPALDDLAEVLRLNSSPAWKSRVQQALLGNQALYSALWGQKEKYAAVAALVTEPTRTPISTMPAPSRTPIPTTLTALPAMPTPTDMPATMVAPTATPPPTVVPRMTSPSYSATCRNPVTLRWSGTLQWYEHYRVRVRYKSSEAGTVDLLTSERLRASEWQTRLPEQVNVGGRNYTVYGMIEWRVLIFDGRTGETVSASDWFHFYFSALSGESCP